MSKRLWIEARLYVAWQMLRGRSKTEAWVEWAMKRAEKRMHRMGLMKKGDR